MRKNKFIWILIFVILLGILGAFLFKKYTDEQDKEFTYTPLMYKVCDNNSCIYLLGSIHIGDSRVNKFNKVIMDAYNDSDKIAVEVDSSDVTVNLNDLMLENGTLDNYISAELNEKLTRFAEEHPKFTYQQFKSFKIGYIYDYLSMLPYLEEGYGIEGVDMYFMNLARTDNKPIISLEKYEDQMQLLIGYSDEFYIEQINNTIDYYSIAKEAALNLYEIYLTGDEEKITALINMEDDGLESEEGKRFIKEIYDDRNNAMAKNVEQFLANDEKVFMVVGCAHVVGDKGIVSLLKNDYQISIVK
ncbi:MAG: TraB/GumN family protein [Bacilli bacterium]|nr:TraB/GumN family protein [Bacilli bacterium]